MMVFQQRRALPFNLFSVLVERPQNLPRAGEMVPHMGRNSERNLCHQAPSGPPCCMRWPCPHSTKQNLYHTEQYDGTQVNLRRLCERLVVNSGISNYQKSRLPEGCLHLVSERTRSRQQLRWPPGAASTLRTT